MQYPKIKKIDIISNIELKVLFDNGELKLYNFSKLLSKPPFDQLINFSLFKQVKVDQNGYGVFWNNDLDLAESELYQHGITINGDRIYG